MSVHKISARFHQDLVVDWPCPECHQRTLQIDKESFKSESLLESKRSYDEDWFEAEMDMRVFSCMAHCSRVSCGEAVVCIGDGGGGQDWDERTNDRIFYYWYKPVSFIPTLSPFLLCGECPGQIAEPIKASFAVYLSQPGSAANLIRISIERMLTAIGIPEFNDKSKRIILHSRLEKLDGQYASYKDMLMAIKFLGNAGSHTHDEVTINDIETAFEIMEYVVNDLFSGRKESIEVLLSTPHYLRQT